jgi:hypothetical protein
MKELQKYAKEKKIRFEMHMDRPDQSENIFGI